MSLYFSTDQDIPVLRRNVTDINSDSRHFSLKVKALLYSVNAHDCNVQDITVSAKYYCIVRVTVLIVSPTWTCWSASATDAARRWSVPSHTLRKHLKKKFLRPPRNFFFKKPVVLMRFFDVRILAQQHLQYFKLIQVGSQNDRRNVAEKNFSWNF